MRRIANAPATGPADDEAEIDALLAAGEELSIVDSVLALPKGGAADPVWERAVHDRLQVRLARRLRQAIERA
ncbi:hypothetical protein N1F89_03010 [Aquibium sp. A9E412]|uniref:hypothetical protein n=1 Tax=Aquibium sp. A9E412 TaxID=2976767 RepID=UPI0025AFADB8|nr:hypothetical protein [Aquibium sp. A9E412]MDN2565180.1 hypothetical protein [Aquibium sp. A9E412]